MDGSFSRGGEFTVGVEEELLLVDAQGALLGSSGPERVDVLRRAAPAGGSFTGEVFADQLELNTPVCVGAEDVTAALGTMRSFVAATEARLMGVGVHPAAPFGRACLSSSPRYDAIVEEYGGLLRTPTSALQVHIGLPDEEAMLAAYRGMRPWLALLRALSASSPFWHGRDSGLASARAAILRSYPRTTGAPLLRSWDEYQMRIDAVVGAAGVPDLTYVWWDLRPRPDLGTLEVRVMDSQPSLDTVAGLTALVQGLVRRAVEMPDLADVPEVVLDANDHRATRHGLAARVVDEAGTMRPLRELGVQAVQEARDVLAPDGLDGPLEVVDRMLVEATESERQRRLVERHGVHGLLHDLVRLTTNVPQPQGVSGE